MSTLEQQFQEAANFVKTWTPGKTIPTDRKLVCYGLYKQVLEGDVVGDRPNMLMWESRSKYDAWATNKGKGKEQAMQEYIEELERQKEEFK